MAKLPGPLRELEQFRMTDGSGVIDLDRFLQTRGYHSFCSAHHDFMYDCERDDYCFTLYCWDRQGQHYASVNDSKVMYYQEFRSKAKFQQVRLAFWTREERDVQWLSIWEALENNVPIPDLSPCQYDVFIVPDTALAEILRRINYQSVLVKE